MVYLDYKDAIEQMRKRGFDIVRCGDCKYSNQYSNGPGGSVRTFCQKDGYYVDSEWFCKNATHIEDLDCYDCECEDEKKCEGCSVMGDWQCELLILGWTPVEQCLPFHNGRYLVTFHGEGITDVCMAYFDKAEQQFKIAEMFVAEGVTAWMQIPQPYRTPIER